MDTNVKETAIANKYLLFENEGEMPIEALFLIGASTKRNDSNKIGFFGSGLKYAIPVLMREGVPFKIFIGENPVSFSTVKKQMRNHEFDCILVNGLETAMTLQMGPQWLLWFAIREIYSNMLDEEEPNMALTECSEMAAGKTRIYIDFTHPNIKDIYNNFNFYFTKNRNDIICYNDNGDAIYSKVGKGINFYRKGIRCFDTKGDSYESAFDYDIQEIAISEARVCDYYSLTSAMGKFWAACESESAIRQFLLACKDCNLMEYRVCSSLKYHSINNEKWAAAIGGSRVVPIEYTGYLDDFNPITDIAVPNELYKFLYKELKDIKTPDIKPDMPYAKRNLTSYQQAILKRVLDWFKECDMDLTYPIEIVEFFDEKIFGMAREGKIYLCTKSFTDGKQRVAEILLEEFMHLRYKVTDESRPFQSLLLSHVVMYMQQCNTNPL